MNKKLTAIALVAAGLSSYEVIAAVPQYSVARGTQIQIGCTVPAYGTAGSTVYSIDAQANNSSSVADTVTLPSAVSTGASCSYAINTLSAQTSVAGGGTTGRWVPTSSNNYTEATGVTPANITIPGSGYSLQAYTFIAQ